jgi:hypothetical protein
MIRAQSFNGRGAETNRHLIEGLALSAIAVAHLLVVKKAIAIAVNSNYPNDAIMACIFML